MTKLAADPAHGETKARLAAALERCLKDQRAPGVPLDTPAAVEAAEVHGPRFSWKAVKRLLFSGAGHRPTASFSS